MLRQKKILKNIIILVSIYLLLTGCSNIFSKKISDIKFNEYENNIFIGDDVNLIYSLSPSDAEYDINDISIVMDKAFTNSGNMKYKATKEGTYNFSIVYDDKIYDSKTITVSAKPVESINIEDIKVGVNLSTDIIVDIFPSDATNKDLSFSIDDESIATIKGNTIYGLQEGTTILTAKSADGPKCQAEINVITIHPTKIDANIKDEYKIEDKQKLNITFYPENISIPEVTMSSSNTNVIELDEDGNLKAIDAGVAIVTIAYSDDVFIKKEVTVNYKNALNISIENKETSLYVGNQLSLNVNTNPEKIKGDLTWTSSDDSIATVKNNGTVTGVSTGIVKISVETENGKKDSITLEIESKPATQVTRSTSSTSSNTSTASSSSSSGSSGGVWLSATGSKYHSINNCGRMNPNKATQVTEQYAIEHGYDACSKCW